MDRQRICDRLPCIDSPGEKRVGGRDRAIDIERADAARCDRYCEVVPVAVADRHRRCRNRGIGGLELGITVRTPDVTATQQHPIGDAADVMVDVLAQHSMVNGQVDGMTPNM